MTEASKIAEFGEKLSQAFQFFRSAEDEIRQQYVSDPAAKLSGLELDDLLERPTRRFLIDNILSGLDWNPDDPTQISEEARSRINDERLYFDYIGLNPQTNTPVLLVEAKGYDVATARRPRGQNLDARAMADLISNALGILKSNDTKRTIISEWAAWLNDLRNYVLSLGDLGQKTLKRVVITAGRWIIIFDDPFEAFIKSGAPSITGIHCFVSIEEIIERHKDIFRLLYRQRLVNTLSLTMTKGEALEVLNPQKISDIYRGIVVATRDSGGNRKIYPTRSVYPALIVLSENNLFAVTDYEDPVLEEPLIEEDFLEFANRIATRGEEFVIEILRLLGRIDLQPQPLDKFPGFEIRKGKDVITDNVEQDSTEAIRRDVHKQKRLLVVPTEEPGGYKEFLIVTGEVWFYKLDQPSGKICNLHSWPKAKEQRVSAAAPHTGNSSTSYTQSGQSKHCAHEPLRRLRGQRCHVEVLETHLCCRACIFHSECWKADSHRLPCPT